MSTASSFVVGVIESPQALREILADCVQLQRNAVEPNIFYESWMLLPVLETFGVEHLFVVLVRSAATGLLTGFFPLSLQARFRGLPIRSLRSLWHEHCFLFTPLVAQQHLDGTIRAFLDWLGSRHAPAHLVEFDLMPADGPVATCLRAEAGRRGGYQMFEATQHRALLSQRDSASPGLSHKHLKELRRLERRLAEAGKLTYRVLQEAEPIEPWIENFLQLEASGWKGICGTALSAENGRKAFFEKAVSEGHKELRVQMLALELNGKPLAIKCNLLSSQGAFAFKIAYDEQYAHFSPGLLLELFNMREFAACQSLQWMDSCAVPDNDMINRLWTGRRELASQVIAARGAAELTLVRLWPCYSLAKKSLARMRHRPELRSERPSV